MSHITMTSEETAREVWIDCMGKRTTGEVRIARHSGMTRLRRAMKTLALFWCLAIVSVFVPVAHFVLVPGLLLAGPIAALVVARQRNAVLGGHGVCPACGESLVIGAGSDAWPLYEVCSHCRAQVRIEGN
jgi:hypothetical protein